MDYSHMNHEYNFAYELGYAAFKAGNPEKPPVNLYKNKVDIEAFCEAYKAGWQEGFRYGR